MEKYLTGPLGQTVYERTYSRTKTDGSKETWPETVARTVRGNAEYLPEDLRPAEDETKRLEELMLAHKVTPAGRHLWASGANKWAPMNCHVIGFDNNWNHFLDMFEMLMLGGGCGSNYSSELIAALPKVDKRFVLQLVCSSSHPDIDEFPWSSYTTEFDLPVSAEETFVSETKEARYVNLADSREGWVDGLRHVLECSQKDNHKLVLVIDFSRIRHRGEPIRGFGGTASGPAPLAMMLKKVYEEVDGAAGHRMTPMEILRIDHFIAEAVVAGNVRRSARMSCMRWNDPFIKDFLRAKSEDGLHWSSNFSVEVNAGFFERIDSEEASWVLDEVANGMLLNGEPGFLNSELAGGVLRSTNPCGEQWLHPGEACCLGHLNLALLEEDEVFEAASLMARFLLRAHFADYVNPRQEEACTEHRRIGVGIYGLQEMAALRFGVKWSDMHRCEELRDFLSVLYEEVRFEADKYAEFLGINSPSSVTTIAPTGTIAKLSGHTEGIHPIFAKWFIRRIRFAESDPALEAFDDDQKEPDLYSDNTVVVSIPCRDSILDIVDESMVEAADDIQLEDWFANQAMAQSCFVDSAISLTVNFSQGDMSKERLVSNLREWLPKVKGLTLFPEVSRAQAPYERISREEFFSHGEQSEVSQGEDCEVRGCPVR